MAWVGQACRIAAALGALAACPSAAGDAAAGQLKSAQCIACHGPAGVTNNPMFPNLAGQNAAYLENQLERFKAGGRVHPVMSPIAEALSAADIEDLASYYSSIAPPRPSGGSPPRNPPR